MFSNRCVEGTYKLAIERRLLENEYKFREYLLNAQRTQPV